MPEPGETEEKDEFVSRCIAQLVGEEGYEQEQAAAICYSKWEKGEKALPVVVDMLPDAVKAGRRHSDSDHKHLRNAIQEIIDAGGEHELMHKQEEVTTLPSPLEKAVQMEAPPDPEKTVINFGDTIKAIAMDGGDSLKLTGYLVRFSDENSPDLTGEFFTKETDFGDISKADVYFNHCIPIEYKGKRIGYDERITSADLKADEVGILAEAILYARNEYEKMLSEMALAGKLGWSSGTASHLVKRVKVGEAYKIIRWKLGDDASLTPTPAEPRNVVIPLKSLLGDNTATQTAKDKAEAGQPAQSASGADAETKQEQPIKEQIMDIDETKLQELIAGAANEAVKAYRESEPPLKTAAANVEVVTDEADRPFRSIAEQCQAIKSFELSKGRMEDPRLKRLKGVASGANENVLTEGGYLLEPTVTAELMKPIHEEGPFTSQVTRLPVSNGSNYGWINGVDETSRSDGSRWGGIRGYWLAEAGSATASKPAFKRINWELKKLAILVYGTDELLADAAQFSAVVQQGAREELAFKVNDAILNGTGAGQPLGIMNSGAKIAITAETNQAGSTVLYENLIKMWARLPAYSKPYANWYINTDVNPQLDQLSLASGTGALEPRFIGYDANGVMRIKGRPVVETEFNATLGTEGDIVLMDPRAYYMWEKTGVEAATSIHLQFLTDETTFRFIYRVDGQPSLSTYLTPYKGTNYLTPFVTIATRS